MYTTPYVVVNFPEGYQKKRVKTVKLMCFLCLFTDFEIVFQDVETTNGTTTGGSSPSPGLSPGVILGIALGSVAGIIAFGNIT